MLSVVVLNVVAPVEPPKSLRFQVPTGPSSRENELYNDRSTIFMLVRFVNAYHGACTLKLFIIVINFVL
jgi:hypothetical protein